MTERAAVTPVWRCGSVTSLQSFTLFDTSRMLIASYFLQKNEPSCLILRITSVYTEIFERVVYGEN